MKTFRWMAASLLLGVTSALFAAESGSVTIAHFEPLQRVNLQTESTVDGVNLSFDALGKSFDLQLETNAGFLSATSRSALPDGVAIYRGGLAGNPDSWARIVVFDGTPRGIIWDGVEMYTIEPADDGKLQASAPVIYRLADVFIQPGSMSCGSESLFGNGAAVYEKLVAELGAAVAQATGAVREIEVGAVGDFEFTSDEGGDVTAALAIADRLNRVDGIFSQEIGVQISVPLIETFSDPLDPFGDATEAAIFLDDVAAYRSITPAQNSLGLTHLYTGRILDGSTVGIAFSDVLCRPNVGAGLTQRSNNVTIDSLVAAHEIGHNFGAPHDGVPGACELEPQTFIMAPSVNGNNKFSPCTIAIMQASADRASCVSALPAVDMSIALNNQSPTVLLGANTVITYDVPNNGSLPATNVVADFVIPTTLTIDSVATSIGSCTNGAGTVNCILGEVPGLSDHTVTITTTPTTVGVGTLTANITSDVDERPVNNQTSLQLTVDPAVDLVIETLTSVSVDLNGTATIAATVRNLAVLDATGVTVSISLGSRVRADSASWDAGACTVAAQQIDCQAANLANQSASSLTVSITALTAGTQGFTVTATSNEADADPTNNSVNSTVRITDPKKESSGGAIGLQFLCLLGLAAFMRRRRIAVS